MKKGIQRLTVYGELSVIATNSEANDKVSIIIPNYNGGHLLENCFKSILKQTYDNIELILVDNGSTDGSIELTNKYFKAPKILKNDCNRGFATATNQGIKESTGKYVLLLNNDTALESNCIKRLVDNIKTFREKDNNVIGIAPKILFYDRPIIDSIGNGIDRKGQAFNIGIGQLDVGQFKKPMNVFGLCFAAALIERSIFNKIGYLDESYFAYFEDVDWCYRANVFGYNFYSEPKAIVRHHHSASARVILKNSEEYYLIQRNLLRTLLKNYFRGNLIQAIKVLLNHMYQAYKNSREGTFDKSFLHFKIVLDTVIRLPLLLIRNVNENLKRVKIDADIWAIASTELQLSRISFDPETYSPVLTLDIFEIILRNTVFESGELKYLKEYLGICMIKQLADSNYIKFPLRSKKLEIPVETAKKKNVLQLKSILGYNRMGKIIITRKMYSYMINNFMLNLIIGMNHRNLNEIATILVEDIAVKLDGQNQEYEVWLKNDLFEVILSGLKWIAEYLEKLDLIKCSSSDLRSN